jgi:hypothetical protein
MIFFFHSFQQSQKLQINIADQIVRQDDRETSDSFNRMASILREVKAQDR